MLQQENNHGNHSAYTLGIGKPVVALFEDDHAVFRKSRFLANQRDVNTVANMGTNSLLPNSLKWSSSK
jgi:hypothetical protein